MAKKFERYKIRMKQTDLRNIPPCYLKNALDAMPSSIRDLLLSDGGCKEGEGEKLLFDESCVYVRSDSTVEIHGATKESRDRILSKLKLFDIEKVG